MNRTKLTRRDVLRYSGAASLLLLPVLRPRLSSAQATGARLVTFYYGNGPTAEIGRMFPMRQGSAWRFDDDLLTSALSPHAEYMSIARGLWIRGGQRPKGAHGGAAITWATGSDGLVHPDVDDHASENESIDHWYAAQTGTQKLYLGVERGNRRVFSSSYAGYDQPSQPEQDMQRAYDALFANLAPGVDLDEAQRRANRRLYVLDTVVEDLKAAQRIFGLASEERERLQRYEASLDAIETQLRAQQTSPGTGEPPDVSFGSSIPDRTRAAIDIIVGAMALGLRNACAFQIGAAYANTNYSFIAGAPHSHHSAQHDGGGDPTLATRWIHEQVAYLLGAMRAIDEGDGSNLLDNAVVLVGCDTPHGNNHNYNMDHPTFLFGRASGRLRGNVDVAGPASGHRDHVDILATAAEALGAPGENMFAQRSRFGGFIDPFFA